MMHRSDGGATHGQDRHPRLRRLRQDRPGPSSGGTLGLPVINLDAQYYDDGWNSTPPEKFAAIQRELVATDQWIIEGNYASTLPIRLRRADTVILLDLPAVTCLLSIARRRWRYRGGQHVDGVYDRITLSFVKYILGYRRHMLPRVDALVTEHGGHVRCVRLTSHRSANQFLSEVETSARNASDRASSVHVADRSVWMADVSQAREKAGRAAGDRAPDPQPLVDHAE
jgi:adenylate kinase family enzyme